MFFCSFSMRLYTGFILIFIDKGIVLWIIVGIIEYNKDYQERRGVTYEKNVHEKRSNHHD